MTVPVQRGPEMGGHGDNGVLSYVAESLRRLEDSVSKGFADVATQLSRLPELYVPRREVERRFDELTIDLGAERGARETDVARLQTRFEEAEKRRTADRRWAVGVLLTVLGLVLTLLGLVLTHT